MSEHSSLLPGAPAHAHVPCPRCEKSLRVRYESLGNWLACKHCGHKFVSRVAVPCPGCKRTLHMQPQFYGRRVVCNHCQHPFRVRVPVACPHCRGSLEVGPRHLGEPIVCSHCHKEFLFGPPADRTPPLKRYQLAALLADIYYQQRDQPAVPAPALAVPVAAPVSEDVQELRAEVERLRAAAADELRRREETDRHWEGLASYAAVLEARVAELGDQTAEAQARLDEHQRSAHDEYDRRESSLTAARREAEHQQAVLKEEADQQRRTADELRAELDFVRQSLDRVSAERDALTAPPPEQHAPADALQVWDDDAAPLARALDAAHGQEKELVRHEEELAAKVQALLADLEAAQRRAAEAETGRNAARQESEEARQATRRHEERARELEERITADWTAWQNRLTEAAANFGEELRVTRGEADGLRLEAQALRAEHGRALGLHRTATAERDALAARAADLEARLGDHARQLTDLRQRLAEKDARPTPAAAQAPHAPSHQDAFFALLGSGSSGRAPEPHGAPLDTAIASFGPITPAAPPPPSPHVEQMLRWAADNGTPPTEKVEEALDLLGPQPLTALAGQAARGDAAVRLGVARSCRWLSERFRRNADLPQAERACAQAVQALSQLTREFPAVAALKAELGANYLQQARTQYQCNQIPEALRTFQVARDMSEALVAEQPEVPSYRRALALCLHDLAVVLLQVRHVSEAQTCLRQAVIHQSRVVAESPQTPQFRGELERIEQLLAGAPVA